MKYLLDTHTFLWFIAGSPLLSGDVRKLIEDPSNFRLLSIGSLWEMAIKKSIGKLELAMSFKELVENQVQANAISLLQIEIHHLERLANLPFNHKDPFDRLLVAQCLSENIPLLSRDNSFDFYQIQRIW